MITNTSFLYNNAESILAILQGISSSGNPMPFDTTAAILNSLRCGFVMQYESLHSVKNEKIVYGEKITGQEIIDWCKTVADIGKDHS